MNQNSSFVLDVLFDGFDALVKEALDILDLWVLREEGKVCDFAFEFIHTTISRHIDNQSDVVFLDFINIVGCFLPWNEQPIDNFLASNIGIVHGFLHELILLIDIRL